MKATGASKQNRRKVRLGLRKGSTKAAYTPKKVTGHYVEDKRTSKLRPPSKKECKEVTSCVLHTPPTVPSAASTGPAHSNLPAPTSTTDLHVLPFPNPAMVSSASLVLFPLTTTAPTMHSSHHRPEVRRFPAAPLTSVPVVSAAATGHVAPMAADPPVDPTTPATAATTPPTQSMQHQKHAHLSEISEQAAKRARCAKELERRRAVKACVADFRAFCGPPPTQTHYD